MTKTLEDMTKQELITLVLSLNSNQNTINKIELLDISVESNTEPLQEVKKVVDSIISEHKDFLISRKQKIEGYKNGFIS